MKNTVAAGAACASLLLLTWPLGSQARMAPVDFRPFVDGRNWIVREPLTYRIGVSKDSLTVPVGFVTDLATIPPALQSFIQQNGPYLLPAVVHDYLYWKQTCTRDQADQIFLLAMIEHAVPDTRRLAIYQAVHLLGGYAWDQNARDRQAGLLRVRDGPDMAIPAAFCARGDMSVADALGRP